MFTQRFFFLISDIQLYQYHKTNYDGITNTIFTQLNFFDNNKWSFLPFNINDWVQQPFDTFPYIGLTN